MEGFERYRLPAWGLYDMDPLTNNTINIDLEEDEEKFYVTADLPGIPKDGIHVSLDEGRRIIIEAHQSQEIEKEGRNFLHRERRGGRILRSIQLPMDIEEDSIEASYEEGTLFISLKKAHHGRMRTIKIR